MPTSAEIKFTNPAQKNIKMRAPFWRAAAQGTFADGYFETQNNAQVKWDQWLHKREFETVATFSRRLSNIQNYDYSKKIINSYTGIFSKAHKTIEINTKDDIREKLLNNTDNLNHSLESFLNAIATELLTVGKSYVATDMDDNMPYSFLIKRENVLDKLIDNTTADFEFFKFSRDKITLEGFETVKRHDIVIYTKDSILFCIPIDDGQGFEVTYKVAEELENILGFIPIRQSSLGLESEPIIKSSAHMDLNLVNIDSELRDLLSVQALSLLSMPKSAWETMGGKGTVIKANSAIIYPDNFTGTPAKWVAYPAQGLDGHFKYMESTIRALHELSNLRRQGDRSVESGISKKMDFIDTESILNILANEIEDIFKKIVSDWASFLDVEIEATIKIDRKFDIETLENLIAQIDNALMLRLGRTVEEELRKKAAGLVVELTEEQKKESDEEIEKMSDATEIIQDEI